MTGRVFRFGLTGWPLGHSLSPVIHRAALEALDLPGEYRLYPVAPEAASEGGLEALLAAVRHGELDGLNVTVPYKEAVLPRMDALSPAAAAVGAVNTISCQDGRLSGDNTDAPGFLRDLEQWLGSLKDPPFNRNGGARQAAVLGAGGSARAVVYALVQAGWEVAILARRLSQAQELAAHLSLAGNHPVLAALPWEKPSFLRLADQAALIVNCTPLGMTPEVRRSPWPAGVPLPPQAGVYDLVYNPPQTALIDAARQAGLPAANGLGMLVEQAALAFEIWTGQAAPRHAMRRAVRHQEEIR